MDHSKNIRPSSWVSWPWKGIQEQREKSKSSESTHHWHFCVSARYLDLVIWRTGNSEEPIILTTVIRFNSLCELRVWIFTINNTISVRTSVPLRHWPYILTYFMGSNLNWDAPALWFFILFQFLCECACLWWERAIMS